MRIVLITAGDKMDRMIRKLKDRKERYLELEKRLSSPECLSDREEYRKVSKEYADLREIVEQYDSLVELRDERRALETMLEEEDEGSEYAALARDDLDKVRKALARKVADIEELLLEEDSAELKRNVIMEIRAGTGGQEAALFAADLYNMYSRYAASRGWKVSRVALSGSELGGLREIVVSVEGDHVFKYLRFEKGTHRVQRVPETESGGRIHTSAATVAVLPEADDLEVEIKAQDLKIDTYRASGAGGQHVNVTDSAIRITHIPTGIVVSCQDERSQHKNKAKAMKVLKARVLEARQFELDSERAASRKKQVGTGDRSEKIRTYNFPENRVTDHRIGLTVYNLANILEGELDLLVVPLIEEDRKLRLEAS
jgi:peptide chain release factor 1